MKWYSSSSLLRLPVCYIYHMFCLHEEYYEDDANCQFQYVDYVTIKVTLTWLL